MGCAASSSSDGGSGSGGSGAAAVAATPAKYASPPAAASGDANVAKGPSASSPTDEADADASQTIPANRRGSIQPRVRGRRGSAANEGHWHDADGTEGADEGDEADEEGAQKDDAHQQQENRTSIINVASTTKEAP